MIEEFLPDLLPLFGKEEINENSEIDIDGNVLKISVIKRENENKITMTVEFSEDEFKKYVDSLDEDIFIEACERFEDMTGVQLNDNVDHDLFKAVVNNVVAEKINRLKEFINK